MAFSGQASSIDAHCISQGTQDAAKNRNQGCLAGAVGAQKSEKTSLGNSEGELPKRGAGAVGILIAQILNLNQTWILKAERQGSYSPLFTGEKKGA